MTTLHPLTCFRRQVCVCLGLICCILVGTACANGADVDRIVANWIRRQKNTTGLKCEAKVKSIIVKGSLGGGYPEDDYKYEKDITWLLDFSQDRVRKEIRGDHQFFDKLKGFAPQYELD